MRSWDPSPIDAYRGLEAGDERYRARPSNGAAALADRIGADPTPVAMTGPIGSGKSTEAAAAVGILNQRGWLAYAFDVDEVVGEGSALTAPLLHFGLAAKLLEALSTSPDATETPTQSLVRDLRASDPRFSRGFGLVRDTDELARAAATELSRAHGGRKIAVLIDGLDRVPDDVARPIALSLTDVSPAIRTAAIVSPALAYGEEAFLLLDRVRPFGIGNLDPELAEARAFLVELARARGETAEVGVIERAARASGGVPRGFLRLLGAARMYARVADRDEPLEADVESGEQDHMDGLRRLLLRGDLAVIREAEGTDGVEVPSEKRARLLTHGLLVEYGTPPDVTVRAHPLVRRLAERGGAWPVSTPSEGKPSARKPRRR